eukprot:augustus_masked-scaffold_2-processed-gene-3.46-mRNA-1 protein AED:0.06 eAED:0.06 QI:0/-1/0/1/-1/1/1/0/441
MKPQSASFETLYQVKLMIKYSILCAAFLLVLNSWHVSRTPQIAVRTDHIEKSPETFQSRDEEDSFNYGGDNSQVEPEIQEETSQETAIDVSGDEENEVELEEVNLEMEVESLGGLKFSDGRKYLDAEFIEINGLLDNYQGLWKLQKMHDEFFSKVVHKKYIPRLSESISKLQFHNIFRQTSTPVIIPFSTMKQYGFTSTGYSFEQLRQKFPYVPVDPSVTPLVYNPKSGMKDGMDLGPAIYAVEQDIELQKAKGFKRNFPRNLKIKKQYLEELGVSHPPFIQKKRFQPPTLWFGTSTADTKLHSDCCDNFVQMIAGVKRWYIMPPTDSRYISPVKCDGAHQSLCWADVPYPNKELSLEEKKKLAAGNGMVIDLKAGEMLYLPAGWWHHIENLGPTIMVNFWTYGCENSGLALDLDPLRSDRVDFKRCPAVAQDAEVFLRND